MNYDTTLKRRPQQILDFIKQSIKETGYPPTVREIGQAVGLKSSSTVHSYLVQLEEAGYIKRDSTKTRAIIVAAEEPEATSSSEIIDIPVIGDVAAGAPIFAEENIEFYLPVAAEFIGTGNHFILQVRGDSMIEAGILDGDFLIVKEQNAAYNGDIVVALIDDEATVKRYFKRNNYVELRPENQSMEPIISDQVRIAGKVAGLLRRM